MIVYAVMHVLAQRPISPVLLLAVPAFGLIVLFALGCAALVGTVQVYFRDTSSFLPYFLRIWLYLSPVILEVSKIHAEFAKHGALLPYLNPLYSLIGSWSDILTMAKPPSWQMWVASIVWATVAFVGGSLFFMSREREFAVRL